MRSQAVIILFSIYLSFALHLYIVLPSAGNTVRYQAKHMKAYSNPSSETPIHNFHREPQVVGLEEVVKMEVVEALAG